MKSHGNVYIVEVINEYNEIEVISSYSTKDEAEKQLNFLNSINVEEGHYIIRKLYISDTFVKPAYVNIHCAFDIDNDSFIYIDIPENTKYHPTSIEEGEPTRVLTIKTCIRTEKIDCPADIYINIREKVKAWQKSN